MTTNHDLVLHHLQTLFSRIREAVLSQPPDRPAGRLGRNAKGDPVKWFDLAADEVVSRYLAEEFPWPVRLLSEEGTPREYGRGAPEFVMVLDPVDGSENFARRISPSGTAMALIPAGQPVNIRTVEYALVGQLFTGQTWTARRGGGAFLDGRPIPPAPPVALEQAIISFDTNRSVAPPALMAVLSRALGVRSFAAAAVVLAMVAGGTLGAHIDLTGNLTPENFLASALLITETGGRVTAADGQPLPDIDTLTQGYRLVAAATPSLHDALVAGLAGK
ncbi:MAG: hypothetical protein D6784_04525 [Chloroflexi bacterium]|nr:MAG: hypothetical protein D6784_04525 [Chloroflexota bacterium]